MNKKKKNISLNSNMVVPRFLAHCVLHLSKSIHKYAKLKGSCHGQLTFHKCKRALFSDFRAIFFVQNCGVLPHSNQEKQERVALQEREESIFLQVQTSIR